MKKYIIIMVILTLFSLSMSSGEQYLSQADFNGGTYTISTPGTYILSENISFNEVNAIYIEVNNVIIDGNGHQIMGNRVNDFGISTNNPGYLSNITIKNTILKAFDRGIRLARANNSIIDNVFIIGATISIDSIACDYTVNNSLLLSATQQGIDSDYDNITVENTNMSTTQYGIFTGGSRMSVKNCNFRDTLSTSIYHLRGKELNVTNCTFNISYLAIRAQNGNKFLLEDSIIEDSDAGAIYLYETHNFICRNNVMKNIRRPISTFHIFQNVNNEWIEIGNYHYNSNYEIYDFDIIPQKEIKLKIIPVNTPFSDIEKVSYDLYDSENNLNDELSSDYAKSYDIINKIEEYNTEENLLNVYDSSNELTNETDILEDVKFDDNNVAVTSGKEVHMGINLTDEQLANSPKIKLSMKANEYGHGVPVNYPILNQFVDFNTQAGTLTVDGVIDEVNGMDTEYKINWVSTSGHPDAENYLYILEDESYYYIAFDVASDNTNEYGKDFVEFDFKTDSNVSSYRIDDYNTKYGLGGFQLTPKVTYKHQVYEVKIPKSEFSEPITGFRLRYYGTESSFPSVIHLAGCINATIENNSIHDNEVEGITLIGALDSCIDNTISKNRIWNNKYLGINLYEDFDFIGKVTPNTGTLSSSIPNRGVDFPIMEYANLTDDELKISGYIGVNNGSSVFANAKVEVFFVKNSEVGDNLVGNEDNGNYYGEGYFYIGDIIADENGNFEKTFNVSTMPYAFNNTTMLSATTTFERCTSEFGKNINVTIVVPEPEPTPEPEPEPTPSSGGSGAGTIYKAQAREGTSEGFTS
ncbi:hypothetical protein J2127_001222, partial [Methanococcus voltae]|uniref:right-handed parallel beta-helix repeat-containing protein n=1 Tax=Methanococcus voltae TaxID=2188 RepID=UPI001AE9C213|nr:hypothetical protein [Methanococcus voltae]